jgi:AcrR family transcriptional regulator
MASEQAAPARTQVGPGRPRRFDEDDLIQTALAFGPDQLALGAVSDALGAPRTTIYNHVRSTDELGRLVLASLLGRAFDRLPDVDRTQPWPELLTNFADEMRTSMCAAGPWLRYLSANLVRPVVRRADAIIEALVGQGFTVEAAGNAVGLVHSVVLDSVNFYAALTGSSDPIVPFKMFDADDVPWIKAAHSRASDLAGEARRYRYNLTCAVEGIRALLDDPAKIPG